MELRPLTTVSASSITTFLDCPRKWYFRYVLGERTPPSAAMKHGTRVHKDIEEYFCLEKDDLETVEAIEAKVNGLFPSRDQVNPEHVEYKAEALGLEMHGLRLLGFIDLPFIDENGKLSIIDWKTRSAFTYVPDAVELLDDVQGKLYAYIGFELLDHLGEQQDQITFSHGNMLRVDGKRGRNSPRSMKVSCTYDRDLVYDWIDGPLRSIVEDMRAVAEIDHPRKVRQETGSCFKYGPCEYKDSPIAALRGRSCYDIPYRPTDLVKKSITRNQGEKMSLQKLMALKKKKQAAEATAEAPVKEEAPAPATITHQGPVEKVESDLVAAPPLDRAKQDFLAGKPQFDLLDYGLNHENKRAFIIWRKEQAEKAIGEQRENPIPPVNPPDAAPDQEPVDLADQTVYDFDFVGVPGIGEKTVENIKEFLTVTGITDLADLLDLDLTQIAGIGKKGEEGLKAAIRKEKNWAPEGEEPKSAPGAYDQDHLFAKAKAIVIGGEQSEPLDHVIARMDGATTATFNAWREDHEVGTEPAGQLEDGAAGADTAPCVSQMITIDAAEVAETINAAVDRYKDGLSVLYIDCGPTKGAPFQALDDLLATAKAQLCEESGMRYWSADKFGKDRRALVDIVLEDPSFLSGHVVARSSNEGMEMLLPEIRQFFDLVVEG